MIRLLLDTGADANCVDRLGRQPLSFVSNFLASDAIRLLVSRGADLEAEMGGNREGLRWTLHLTILVISF